ncbi:MAG: O-antigen ligase family protein [Desulfovibrionaceae bacterium]|nr:O-antigen ligase family protein [Desulfovibrionaceae bacterium]
MSFCDILFMPISKKEKCLHAINAALIYIVILVCHARCAFLSFSGLLAIFILRKHTQKKYRFLFLALWIFGIWYIMNIGRGNEAISDIQKYMVGNDSSSLGLRFSAWIAGIHAFFERPLFGWGHDPMSVLYASPSIGKYFGKSLQLTHFHNDVIHILVTGGLTLFSGWMLTVSMLFKKASKDISFQVVLICLLFSGCVEVFWTYHSITIAFIIILYLYRHIMYPSAYMNQ